MAKSFRQFRQVMLTIHVYSLLHKILNLSPSTSYRIDKSLTALSSLLMKLIRNNLKSEHNIQLDMEKKKNVGQKSINCESFSLPSENEAWNVHYI